MAPTKGALMKKMILWGLLVAGNPFGAVSAFADQSHWYHVRPLESGPISTLIDFQIQSWPLEGDVWGGGPASGPTSYETQALPVWVNVRGGNLEPNDRVRVMIISYQKHIQKGSDWNYSGQQIDEVDLAYIEPGHFAAQAKPILIDYQFNDGNSLNRRHAVRQEVIVWVNGQIYKDPITQSNMGFNLRDYLN
jgi:hypothetical protein